MVAGLGASVLFVGSIGRADDAEVPPIVVERAPVAAPQPVPVAVRSDDYPPRFANRTFLEVSGGYGINGFGPGFTGRIGSTFSGGFYLGGSVTYYPAERLTVYGNTAVPQAVIDDGTLLHFDLEVGYDIGRSPFVVRVYGGPAWGMSNLDGGGHDDGLTFVSGVHATYDLPHTPLFVSAELRGMVTFAELVVDASVGGFGGVGFWIDQ